MCVCVCSRQGEGTGCLLVELALAVWVAVYLTSYSIFLTIFHESLSLPCRCHAGLHGV